MKRTIFFLSLCSCLISSAQNANVRLSEETKEPAKSVVFDMVGFSDDAYYLARFKRSGLTGGQILLEKYDSNLKLKRIKELSASVGNTELDYSTAYMVDNQLYAVCYGDFKDEDKKVAYVQKVNTEDLSTPEDPVQMLVMEGVSNSRFGDFELNFSQDDSKVAFAGFPGAGSGSSLFNKKKQDNVEAIVGVFDSNMKPLWSKHFELPYKEKDYNVIESKVDDDGNFYWLGYYDEDEYIYKVSAFRNGGNEAVEYDIELTERFVSDCALMIVPDGTIVVAGFYSEKNADNIKGIFYVNIDPASKAIITETYKPFDKEFMAEFMKERKAKKGKELKRFSFNKTIIRTDGGVVLMAEKYYVTQSTTTDSQGNTRTTYTYHRDELIVSNINPDGTIEWVTRIPKRQASSADFYLGYTDHVKDDKIYLLFNDNEKNISEKKEDKIFAYNGKKSIATLVTISSDGSWEKSALFDNKEEGVLLRPHVGEQINNRQLLITDNSYSTPRKGVNTNWDFWSLRIRMFNYSISSS